MMRLKRILVPVDFSKEAELAFEWAVRLGKEEQEAAIYLLHILSPTSIMEGGFEVDALAKEQWGSADGKEDVDPAVMTTHGRHGLSRMVHPNLIEKVVRVAPCPVLVLHLNPKMEALAKS